MRSTKVLLTAWHEIRRNAETSQTASTKQKAREFGSDLPKNLRLLQSRLKDGYQFAKAYGALPSKGNGKAGRRPIVVAPLEDRIVQRAILDVLQGATELTGVRNVLATETSIGGIRGRGVDHGIAIFQRQVELGHKHVAGSDISCFFTKIQVPEVIEFLANEIDEPDFISLVERALTVELANGSMMSPEDRKLFPTGGDGVAQGCPLSALAGNIVLRDFDRAMNGRGVVCVRYIDDFIITAAEQRKVSRAMSSARQLLSAKGMDIYDPVESPKKAFIGAVGEPHVFLGYELIPSEYPPAPAAAERLLSQIDTLLSVGKQSIRKAVTGRPLSSSDRCFAQTLDVVSHTVKGWRKAFRASNSPRVFRKLDEEIDRKLGDFERFFHVQSAKADPKQRRRALGVSSLVEG